jgi:hypothetical protein
VPHRKSERNGEGRERESEKEKETGRHISKVSSEQTILF